MLKLNLVFVIFNVFLISYVLSKSINNHNIKDSQLLKRIARSASPTFHHKHFGGGGGCYSCGQGETIYVVEVPRQKQVVYEKPVYVEKPVYYERPVYKQPIYNQQPVCDVCGQSHPQPLQSNQIQPAGSQASSQASSYSSGGYSQAQSSAQASSFGGRK